LPPIIVAIDCQALLGDIQTGLGVYARNLVEHLEEFNQDVRVVRLYPPAKKPLKSTPQRLIWEQVQLPWAVARTECDIFHSPALSMPLMGKQKKVATAHDLIIVKHPEMMSGLARKYFAEFIPRTLRKADHIISNSISTKKDLQKYLRIPEEKITVVPLGIQKEFLGVSDSNHINNLRRKFKLIGQYILSVAAFEPRKNHIGILKGFAEARDKLPKDTGLALVGRENAYQRKMISLADELGISESVAFCGYLPVNDLAAMYQGAAMLLFPSIEEGFGIPIIEAFAKGIPVITSSIEATKEIAGDAAWFVNPQRTGEIAQAINELMTDEELRKSLIEKGTARAAGFSWEKHARETIRIYNHVLGRTIEQK
jgi:glycosyltransferase involved in cell wall biosynthesis